MVGAAAVREEGVGPVELGEGEAADGLTQLLLRL